MGYFVCTSASLIVQKNLEALLYRIIKESQQKERLSDSSCYNCEKRCETFVKLPKGFGKNYFTLRAITATSNQVSLHAVASRVETFHLFHFSDDDFKEELEEDPPNATALLEIASKPCHCNRYYFKRTKKTLRLYPFQKHDFDYFKNLNNSISPPNLSIFLKPKMKYQEKI